MAGKTYRVGVIGRTGHGDYGHAVDMAFQYVPQAQVVAVADDDNTGLSQAASRHPGAEVFLDYRHMLEKVRPDIVAICPRWVDKHSEIALVAIEYGAHIYMEKPLCQTLEQADALVSACQRTHTKLAIAHPTHYSPRLAAAKRLIEAGEIGEVLEYRARGKEDARGGAEDLWVLGTHLLDMILLLGGKPQWCFATMTLAGKPVVASDVYEGAEGLGPLAGDALHAMYKMSGPAMAYFASVREMRGKPGAFSRYGLQVLGSKGVIEILEGPMPPVHILRDASWSPGRNNTKWETVSSAGIGKPEPLTDAAAADRHAYAARDLIAAIEEDREPANGIEAGRNVVEMIMAVFESHRLQAPVNLPLANRKHPLRMLGS